MMQTRSRELFHDPPASEPRRDFVVKRRYCLLLPRLFHSDCAPECIYVFYYTLFYVLSTVPLEVSDMTAPPVQEVYKRIHDFSLKRNVLNRSSHRADVPAVLDWRGDSGSFPSLLMFGLSKCRTRNFFPDFPGRF